MNVEMLSCARSLVKDRETPDCKTARVIRTVYRCRRGFLTLPPIGSKKGQASNRAFTWIAALAANAFR